MEDILVTYETALLAKEKGFDEEIDCHYGLGEWDAGRYVCTDDFIAPKNSEIIDELACSAPTQKVLIEWLKTEYNIIVDFSDSIENDIVKALKTIKENNASK